MGASPARWARALIPAKTQAEALPTGSDLVLGFNVREASSTLAIDAQNPVSHSHSSLRGFASRSELWREEVTRAQDCQAN